MMKFLKSVWMRLRKSNQLPGNEVLVPMTPTPVEEVKPVKPKRVIVRKKKDVNS